VKGRSAAAYRTRAEVGGIDRRFADSHAHRRGERPATSGQVAEHIPCADAAFDTVVLCLAIEHIDPFEGAIEEVPGPRPRGPVPAPPRPSLLQAPGSGWVEVIDSDETFWRVSSYLDDDVSVDMAGPGVRPAVAHRPISRYVHGWGGRAPRR